MRILFIGTVRFSHHCLKVILDQGSDVVAVFTMLYEKAKFNSDYMDLKPLAGQRNIPVFQVNRLNDAENVQRIKELAPDVIFVFGFSQIISREILDIPPLGCIGTHPALLPKNRGRHPLIWTLIEDLPESGLTFFLLDEGADSGDIVWQRQFPVTDEDDAGTLYEKTMELASEGIEDLIRCLECGKLNGIPQDHTQANYWTKRSEEDGEVDWSGSARGVWNLVRALTRPYVGAHTYLGESRLTVWKVSVVSEPTLSVDADNSIVGQVLAIGMEGAVVRTGEGFVRIEELGPVPSPILKVGDILGVKVK